MNSKYFKYILGFSLLSVIISSFYISKLALFIVSAIFIIIAIIEYRKMFEEKEIYPHKLIPELVGIACAYVFIGTSDLSAHHCITPILLAGTILTFIITVLKNKKPYIMTSLSTICAFLLIFCGLYIIKLTYYFEQQNAQHLIVIYFLAVLSGDWFASIIGPKVKKRILLAKEISPNKTIAGAIANLCCSIVSCLLLNHFLGFKIIHCIMLGAIISIFSQIGDLTISSFKRDIGINHSSTLFGDYGGILDRVDAFIFSAPAAYYFLFIITII